jgi:hypothetical protein
MPFTSVPTEQTTAVTDAVLVLLAIGCLVSLRRFRDSDPWKVDLWSWVLGLLALAAGLGAAAHGFEMSEGLRTILWQPLFLSLGLVVALFVVAAVHDWKGQAVSRRLLPVMLAVGVGFFAVTRLVSGSFLVFVVYEAVAMVFALAVYVTLAVGQRLPAAGIVALAIVLNIVAAAIQASGTVRLTIGVPFDHNGVFHLVQMVGVVVLVMGLQRGLAFMRAGADCRSEVT